MGKIVALLMIVCLCFSAVAYAQEYGTYEMSPSYVMDKGLFGCAYKVGIWILKTCDLVLFGRDGEARFGEYFRFDKLHKERHPKF